ncbi:hypothetical protein, partial [Pseudomonas syringae group genomosp. 7]|uniref:hypothetical protein n=1 Tax=Pseudomonas syringae group genomosp. 7 TaxID=251699 RepID=UPI00377057E4
GGLWWCVEVGGGFVVGLGWVVVGGFGVVVWVVLFGGLLVVVLGLGVVALGVGVGGDGVWVVDVVFVGVGFVEGRGV